MTTATDSDALLAAVLAAPDDDLPRLAYADWCEENGDGDRAAFIRAQIAIALEEPLVCGKTGDNLKGFGAITTRCRCRPCRLRRAEYMSGRRHVRVEWAYRISYEWGMTPMWRRGFVHAITCTAADWLAHGPAVVRAQPVRAVRLAGMRPGTTDREPGFRDYYCWEGRWSSPIAFLFKHLKTGLDSWRNTEEECMADLSAAALAWARSEAGLPSLEVA